MKKMFISLLTVATVFFAGNKASAQIKIGVFDIDVMVTAMPAYAIVDSLLTIYQNDSIGGEYNFYVSEFKRLDSTLKFIDTPGVKAGTITATKLKYDNDQKIQLYSTLVNWRDIAQRKYNSKKAILSRSLYQQVSASYEKILKAKGYVFVAKPGAYEYGTRIDNLFISVAKDLKLTSLPQELMILGVDPDAPVQGQAPAKAGANKPASH